MKLVVARHGETNYNVKKLTNSIPTEKVYLTPRGVEQAKQLAHELKNHNFDIFIISEFPRTEQTASIVNLHHLKPMFIDERVNEVNTGTEGVVLKDYWEALEEMNKRNEKTIGVGETFEELKQRVFNFLDDLKKKKQFKSILVVSHLAVIHMMLLYFNKEQSFNEIKQKPIANCEYLEFEL